ncbi:MAG: hypothetical protein M3455_06870, partial [Actinomycetota bacterium]|nr:hypothetical protein [Actinomycetota bacterium]
MDICVLGPVTVHGGEALRPRDRLVLGALAVKRGHVLAPAEIADAVWGDTPPPSWPKQVQICVVSLRKALGPNAIETVSGRYRLATDGVDVDVDRFKRLIERGQTLLAAEEPGRAARAFSRALATWKGSPFDELGNWPPARTESHRLEELYRSAQEDLLHARLAIGEHREVAAEAETLVAQEPLRERRWAILALAQYRSGRQADALRSLQQARQTLVEQLGIDPGPGLVNLETAILRQDVALRPPSKPPAVSADCPYRGLAHYDVDDSDSFFGRDADVVSCLDRLRRSPLLVVAGPSGCGKSSLVRAGLVPALRRQGRAVVVIVPDSEPLITLAGVTEAAGAPAVLVVDQFEGLFTAGGSAEVVRDFCARLAAYARDRAPVVIAVRADHLANLAVEGSLSRLAERGLHLVRTLSGEGLREAITRPATEVGLRIEEGLIDLVERDTDGEPGALPLMSHALAETWQRRDGNVLTVEGYRAAGGIRSAVARSAERLYDGLPPGQRTILRSVVLRLVAPSIDGDPTRCRVHSSVLCDDPDRERLVSLLVGARLVTTHEDTVELAHEALARAWPRLRSWLDEDSAGQRILRHLSAAADGWTSLARPDGELYRGARLDTALEWRDATDPDLTAVEADFLRESSEQAATERTALAVRARQHARQNRRLRGLLAMTAAFLIGTLVAGFVAVHNGREASGQRDAALTAQETGQIEALANSSLALRSTDRDVAALLAVEGYRRWPADVRTRSALLGTFTADPGFMGYTQVPDAGHLAGALIPGTSAAAVALDGRELAVFDMETGELDRPFPPAEAGTGGESLVRVSGDGRLVAQLVSTPHDGCGDLERLRSTDDEGCAALSVYEVG